MKRVFAHIGFSFALTMLVLNLISANYVKYVMIGLAVIMIASLLIKKYRRALAVPVCFGAALFACVVFSFTYNNVVLPEQALNKQSAVCEFYITSLPEIGENGEYSYEIQTTSVELKNAPQNMKLKLKTYESVKADAYKIIKGKLTFYQIGKTSFASYGYWGKSIFLSSRLKGYYTTKKTVNSPMRYVLKAREGIIRRLCGIPNDEGALSIALMTGDKSRVSNELINSFKFAGASHLMAVSGLHLTALSGFILLVLKKLRIKDKLAFSLTIFAILYYAALCGFSKSVVRAGIMMSVLMLGRIVNKHGDALNSLGLAAFIICLNPFAVCDIGAVLSILCVLALTTAFPYLNKKIQGLKLFKTYRLNKAAKYILSGIACAFCILAYSLCATYTFFGYASLISLFSSLILIPLGSFATILTFITNFAIRIKIGLPFILLTKTTNRIIILIVEKLASLRFAIINFENYFGFIAALILIIFALCFIINKKHIKKAAVICTVILIGGLTSVAIMNANSSYVLIASKGAVAVCNKDITVIFGVNSKDDYYSVRSFLSSRTKHIDCIFVDEDNRYNKALAKQFGCDEIIYRTHSKTFSDGLSFDYKTNRNTYDFTADIDGVKLFKSDSITDGGDIFVINRICRDKNGVIDLSNGDIIYRISDKNFRARRVNVWEE